MFWLCEQILDGISSYSLSAAPPIDNKLSCGATLAGFPSKCIAHFVYLFEQCLSISYPSNIYIYIFFLISAFALSSFICENTEAGHKSRWMEKYLVASNVCPYVLPCAVGLTPGCPSRSPAVHYWAAAFHRDGLFHGADCAGAAVACRGPRRSPLSPKTSAPDSWHHPHRLQRRKETWLAWKTWLCCGARIEARTESRQRNLTRVFQQYTRSCSHGCFMGDNSRRQVAVTASTVIMSCASEQLVLSGLNAPPDCRM